MKKIFFLLIGTYIFSCDADRTELPRQADLEVAADTINAMLYERIVLKVIFRRPVSNSPDSTYVEVKNVSGSALEKVGFYLESCQKADAHVEDCAPDYYFSLNIAESLKDQEAVVDKISRFVDFNYSNKIYITSFKSDTTFSTPLAERYLYSQIKKTIENSTDTSSYKGSGKVYIQADGTIFCRGNIFVENESAPRKIRLSGNIAKNNQVYIKDMTQRSEMLPYLFFGNVTNKTLSAKANITKDSAEILEILLK